MIVLYEKTLFLSIFPLFIIRSSESMLTNSYQIHATNDLFLIFKNMCYIKQKKEMVKVSLSTFIFLNTGTSLVELSNITVFTKTSNSTHVIAWFYILTNISTCFLALKATGTVFFISTTYFS